MNTTLENPAQVPELGDRRLEQMRLILLEELESVERRGERRTRAMGRRGRVLIAAAALVAAIYTVPAVAEERWWWVSSPDDPLYPVTQVFTVGRWTTEQLMIPSGEGSVPTARVTAGDEHWTVQAYASEESGLCMGISPDPPRPANEGAGIGCGFPVEGLAPQGTKAELHHVGYVAGTPGRVASTSPKFLFGPATPDVRHVDLENANNGRVIRVETHALPEEVGVDARFWIVVLAQNDLIHNIVPRGESGDALERWRLPIAQ
jgi:hypothetical protein